MNFLALVGGLVVFVFLLVYLPRTALVATLPFVIHNFGGVREPWVTIIFWLLMLLGGISVVWDMIPLVQKRTEKRARNAQILTPNKP